MESKRFAKTKYFDFYLSNKGNIHQNPNALYAYLKGTTTLDGNPVSVITTVRKTPQRNKFWMHQVILKENGTDLVTSGAKPDLVQNEKQFQDGSITDQNKKSNPSAA